MFKVDSVTVQRAILFAKAFHHGQMYGSYDYVDHHLFGVAKLAQEFSEANDIGMENVIVVSILHDITEDTSCINEQLSVEFGPRIAKWVSVLDKNEYVDSDAYIAEIRKHSITRLVKTADALFNYQSCIMNANMGRAAKYSRLLEKLNE